MPAPPLCWSSSQVCFSASFQNGSKGAVYTLESIPAPFTPRQYADAILQGLEGIQVQKKAS
ncbi:MAG TPA: hypothetical protein VKB93_27625 [Thermoanaerobaculia bacterium]|nr:hypothetical protein [Thermoanaerobaculia bacterium]